MKLEPRRKRIIWLLIVITIVAMLLAVFVPIGIHADGMPVSK
jgi:flagellar basal body-associated protein FliL